MGLSWFFTSQSKMELYPSFLLLLLACSVHVTVCKDFDTTAENVTDGHTTASPMKKRTIPASIIQSLYISYFKGKDEAEIDTSKQMFKDLIDKFANIAKKNVTEDRLMSLLKKTALSMRGVVLSIYRLLLKGKDEAGIDAVKQELKNIIDKLAKIAKIKFPKLCKGIQVISECNANCLNADVRCQGSDLVKKADIPFSAVKLNASTYSTTWSVPDARSGDRCSVTCPGERNNSFAVTCRNHVMDKKDDPPRWFNVERVRRTCKAYEGEDKRLWF